MRIAFLLSLLLLLPCTLRAQNEPCATAAVALSRAEQALREARSEADARHREWRALVLAQDGLPADIAEDENLAWELLETSGASGLYEEAVLGAVPEGRSQLLLPGRAGFQFLRMVPDQSEPKLLGADGSLMAALLDAEERSAEFRERWQAFGTLGDCRVARAATRGRPHGGAFPGRHLGQVYEIPGRYRFLWVPGPGIYLGTGPLRFRDAFGTRLPSSRHPLAKLVQSVEDPLPVQAQGRSACRFLEKKKNSPEGWEYRQVTASEWRSHAGKLAGVAGDPSKQAHCVLAPK
jgi:hypothetical protein